MSARKDDKGKPPISLIPRSALLAEAKVMASGASRYGAHNWRGGMKWSRLGDAAMRHILAFMDGQALDDGPDGSGESHLANARCCLAFLIEYAEYGLGEDDRHMREAAADASLPVGIQLIELDDNSTGVFRKAVGGKFVIGLPPRYRGGGTLVWAVLGQFDSWHYVADFEEGEDCNAV